MLSGVRRPSVMPAGSDPLAPWVAERLGVAMVERRSVSGGCIHQAWCLRLADGGRLFAKTNHRTSLALLEAEADGLKALKAVALRIRAKQAAAGRW
jgi:fructosamine-3-kinase